MNTNKKHFLTLIIMALAGCAGVKVIDNGDSVRTVISDQGTAFNGGWSFASAEAVKKAKEICLQSDQVATILNESRSGTPGWTRLSSSITFRCNADLGKLLEQAYNAYKQKLESNAELSLIANKVELTKKLESLVPFEIASNNTKPTIGEAKAIALWATLRDEWAREERKIFDEHLPMGTPLQRANESKIRSYRFELAARISELIVALYQGKLSYSEFAQKRYEISQYILTAVQAYQKAALESDRDLQIKQQAIAEQQASNNIAAWNTYMQSVNTRPVQLAPVTIPTQPVRIQTNCISQKSGGMVTTNCN